jgi:uncharacterized protein
VDSKRSYFRCQRSGNCCRVGTGRVWVTSADLVAMAGVMEMSEQAFTQRFVVRVGEQLSLREAENGACLLLDGAAECMVYQQRPQQCRDFPEWSCFDRDDRAWQLATEYCPGIHRVPDAEVWAEGWRRLQQLYQRLEQAVIPELAAPCVQTPGLREGSSLEVDAFLAGYPSPESIASTQAGPSCPALIGTHCTAGSVRPLACRNLSPNQLHQSMLEVQQIAEHINYPWSRGEWCSLILDRAEAWRQIAAKLPSLEV